MKESLISILQYPPGSQNQFEMKGDQKLYGEWRQGHLFCHATQKTYALDDGIIDFLHNPSPEVVKEQQGSHEEIRVRTSQGEGFCVTPESIQRFEHVFKSLPQGDGSYFFQNGGSFQNFVEGAHRFYTYIDQMDFKPGKRVLEIGAGFCWASREIAKRGCELVSLDIANHLKVADIYLKEGLYFERVYADMNHLPFKDGSFDIVFAAAAIHHASDLNETFRELKRVLKPGGRIWMINECFIGLLEKGQQHSEDFAFNDHYYPVPHWVKCLKTSGFRNVRVQYLSFLQDYIARKEARAVERGWKLRLARWVVSWSWLDRTISFLSIPMRVCFRPRSVFIDAVK